MSKKLTHLLRSLEITLHSLHEEVREHNKDYFSDDGQEYVESYREPYSKYSRQRDVVDKIRSDLKKLNTEQYIDVREKNKPWVRKLNPNYKPTNRRRIT